MSAKDGLEPLFERPLSGDAVRTLPSALVPARTALTGTSVQLEPLDAAKHAADLYRAGHDSEDGLRIWDYLTTGPWPDEAAYRAVLRQQTASFDPVFFAVRTLDNNRVCGQTSYLDGSIEVGVPYGYRVHSISDDGAIVGSSDWVRAGVEAPDPDVELLKLECMARYPLLDTVSDATSDRVSDSVHPVHSWKDSQMTDGRLAASMASAIRGIIAGGRASNDAVVAQYLRNPRRDTPLACRISPTVGVFFMLFSSRKTYSNCSPSRARPA